MESHRNSVGIIGAGISGLAAAVSLVEQDPGISITIFDKNNKPGGLLQTDSIEGCLVEKSADMFSTKLNWAVELCRKTGFEDQLVSTNQGNRGAVLATASKVATVPSGFSLIKSTLPKSVLQSPILSRAGKLRFLLEPVYAKASQKLLDGKEISVEEFGRLHWGKEVFQRIVQPLVSGIYTADPAKLSMKVALEEFFDQGIGGRSLLVPSPESNCDSSDHGVQASLDSGSVTAADKESRGARYGLFVAPKEGMNSFAEHLRNWLQERGVRFRFGEEVESVASCLGGTSGETTWEVCHSSEKRRREVSSFRSVILAGPATHTSSLLKSSEEKMAELVGMIPYASVSIVIAIYRREDFPDRGKGLKFGMVVPHHLGSPLIATSFSSQKFAGRAPDDLVLTRSFVGGALNPGAAQWTDSKTLDVCHRELCRWFPIGSTPKFQSVVRYPSAMPQYNLGHNEIVEKIFEQESRIKGLFVAGNGYRGVGIPQCVRSGAQAAGRLISEWQQP